jgi:hypothetical protein
VTARKCCFRSKRIWWAIVLVLVWCEVSSGAEVSIDFVFPEEEAEQAEVSIDLVFPEEEVEQVLEQSVEMVQKQAESTTFEALVVPPIKPKIAAEPEVEMKEGRMVIVPRPLEISSAVEGGRISLLGQAGTQFSFKALAERDWHAGLTLDLNVAFEHFNLDDAAGDGNGVLVNLGARQDVLDGSVKIGGLLTWAYTDTEIIGLQHEVHSFGFGVLASFQKDLGPVILSGGVIYRFLQDTGDLERSTHILFYGLGLGIPIGRRFVANLEGFQINTLDRGDDPIIIGAGLTFFVTRRWGLTLGWKTTQNSDNYSAHEGTLGASVRF